MKNLFFHIIILLCAVAISCKAKVTQEDLIRSALALKLEQWRNEQIITCRTQALKDAEVYVDSMMIVYSLPSKLDTIQKPPKPMKPPKPVFKTKPDSVKIDSGF